LKIINPGVLHGKQLAWVDMCQNKRKLMQASVGQNMYMRLFSVNGIFSIA
jgi:hypothetical protein